MAAKRRDSQTIHDTQAGWPMNTLKKLYTSPRIIILAISLLLMLVALHPNPFNNGVVINSVVRNSSAYDAGITGPLPTTAPMSREVVTAVNNQPVTSVEEYYAHTADLKVNQTVLITTTEQTYRLKVKPLIRQTVLNETEIVTIPVTEERNITVNGSTMLQNVTVNTTEIRNKVLEEVLGAAPLGLRVDNAPTTNLRKGLDLQGGTRVVLEPTEPISDDTLNLVVDSLTERLNTFGLSDIIVTPIRDRPSVLGEPNKFVLVEIAGTTQEEVKELLSRQGKFEAKIGNETVFRGGQDITYVCRTAECSGLHSQRGCGATEDGQIACSFLFSIHLSPDAAQRQADVTRTLRVVGQGREQYLEQDLVLFLDNNEASRLRVGADLKGRAVTEVAISGSGTGRTQAEAVTNTLTEMKRLQTILISGSLPVQLQIVRSDSVSSSLGAEFLRNAILIGFLALLAVVAVVTSVYRSVKLSIPIVITAVCEVLITLGIAALINWNLDLAAIAGLIIAVGTGVDHQIMIADEALKKSAGSQLFGWKQRIKRAFFVIFAAYFTTFVAMIPLLFAGAALLKGFAIITLIGISVGVFITRPAFAVFIDVLLNNED